LPASRWFLSAKRKEAVMRSAVLVLMILLMGGCTNVAQMQRKYLEGDESQLDKLMEIVSRPDYPYATRRKAAKALGEIGDRRAVPVLIATLHGYEQRNTLRLETLIALGKIGDRQAVEPIGRMLDFQLETAGAEIRMGAIEVLGQLGGEKSAGILVNALRYYDIIMLRNEQRAYRGVFSGEEQQFPFPPGYGGYGDSTRTGRRNPMGPMGPTTGMFPGEQAGGVSMFGTPMEFKNVLYNPTPEERELTHASLVRVGEDAVPVIEKFLISQELTNTLMRELGTIIEEIRNPGMVVEEVDEQHPD